jgi:glycosyltransferase involved in cell wall biosynthesis
MRIMLISGEFPPMQGGVGDYTREMARAFAALGHHVAVLVPDSLAGAYRDASARPWQVLPVIENWKWGCWQQVISALRQARPDIVDIQYQAAIYHMRVPAINLLPWRLRRQAGSPPIVATYHDLKPPYLFPKAGPLRPWVVRALARHSQAAILTNAEDLNAAGTWPFVRQAGDRPALHHIPIGSNIAVAPPAGFERAAWRARQGYRAEDFVWAYFGFLNESKGGETLVHALARAQIQSHDAAPVPCHLLMIGGRAGSSDPTNQAYAAYVERLIAQSGLADRVRSTGYVSSEEVSAALLSADVVVLPYRDGISFRRGSLHAALAHGCPVVSTTPRVPLPELRDGENVLLVPPEDPEALSQAVLRLYRDPGLRRRIGDGARALAQQFTWEHIARRTLDEVFTPLLDRP